MYLVTNALSEQLGSQYPFWQAPLPFDLISADMSGRISAQGAHGIIRIAAHDTRDSLNAKINAYRKHHTAPSFCFAHCLPQQPQGDKPDTFAAELLQTRLNTEPLTLQRGDHFLDLLDTAIAARPRAIGFAQGLPDRETLSLIREQGIFTFAIVGNLLEALSADDFGVDALVLQGMEAGGERSAFSDDLPHVEQTALSLLQQVRAYSNKPLIVWGDLTGAADIVAASSPAPKTAWTTKPARASSTAANTKAKSATNTPPARCAACSMPSATPTKHCYVARKTSLPPPLHNSRKRGRYPSLSAPLKTRKH